MKTNKVSVINLVPNHIQISTKNTLVNSTKKSTSSVNFPFSQILMTQMTKILKLSQFDMVSVTGGQRDPQIHSPWKGWGGGKGKGREMGLDEENSCNELEKAYFSEYSSRK